MGRHVGQDALRFAGLGLLAVGLAGIRHQVQRQRIAQGLLGSLGPGQQTALVVAFRRDLLRHDQPVFRTTAVRTL
jgi:hypothetical protein